MDNISEVLSNLTDNEMREVMEVATPVERILFKAALEGGVRLYVSEKAPDLKIDKDYRSGGAR